MARSKSRGGGGARRGASPEPVEAEIEVVAEESGMGFEAGVAIVTTIILFVAVLMVDYDRGKNYGEGMMFKGKYGASSVEPVSDSGGE